MSIPKQLRGIVAQKIAARPAKRAKVLAAYNKLMAEGKFITYRELADMAGVSSYSLSDILKSLRDSGAIKEARLPKVPVTSQAYAAVRHEPARPLQWKKQAEEHVKPKPPDQRAMRPCLCPLCRGKKRMSEGPWDRLCTPGRDMVTRQSAGRNDAIHSVLL